MAKLQDLFTQARRTQRGASMGFQSRNRSESHPHAAALVVEFDQIAAGQAEAALKSGADGLLFTWNGQDNATLEAVKKEVDIVKATKDQLVTGLRITGGWEKLDRESLTQIKNQGIQYIIFPLTAPARLLAQEEKGLEKVVAVPMREGEFYPLFIRNLSAFDSIASVLLDFELNGSGNAMSIESVLHYRAVREAVRFPAFFNVEGDLSEEDAYTIMALGVQAVILKADANEETTRSQIKALHTLLEKIFKEEKEKDATPSLSKA